MVDAEELRESGLAESELAANRGHIHVLQVGQNERGKCDWYSRSLKHEVQEGRSQTGCRIMRISVDDEMTVTVLVNVKS